MKELKPRERSWRRAEKHDYVKNVRLFEDRIMLIADKRGRYFCRKVYPMYPDFSVTYVPDCSRLPAYAFETRPFWNIKQQSYFSSAGDKN